MRIYWEGQLLQCIRLIVVTYMTAWLQVLPGHYLGGRYPKQAQQFALTPKELHMRECAASLEEMSPMQFRKAGLLAREEERDPSSARSSTELDHHVDQLFRISV